MTQNSARLSRNISIAKLSATKEFSWTFLSYLTDEASAARDRPWKFRVDDLHYRTNHWLAIDRRERQDKKRCSARRTDTIQWNSIDDAAGSIPSRSRPPNVKSLFFHCSGARIVFSQSLSRKGVSRWTAVAFRGCSRRTAKFDRVSAFPAASLDCSSRDRVNGRPRGCALRLAESGYSRSSFDRGGNQAESSRSEAYHSDYDCLHMFIHLFQLVFFSIYSRYHFKLKNLSETSVYKRKVNKIHVTLVDREKGCYPDPDRKIVTCRRERFWYLKRYSGNGWPVSLCGDTLERRAESSRVERGGVVRSGRARRKTLPRTSAQSPRQLERVTLLLFLLTIYLSFLLQPSCSLPLAYASFYLSSFLRSTDRSILLPLIRSVHFLLSSLAFAPFHRRHPLRVVSSSSFSFYSTSSYVFAPRPPPLVLFLSHPPLIVSFTFSQPLVEQAEPQLRATVLPRAPRLPSPSTT